MAKRVCFGIMALMLSACDGTAQQRAIPDGVEHPGERIEIRAADLPPPSQGAGAVNFPRPVPMGDDGALYLPEGFVAEIFTDAIDFPRWMVVAENSDVYVAVPNPRFARLEEGNLIWRLRDTNGDGMADEQKIVAKELNMPLGMVIDGDALFVSDVDGIWRFPITADGALGDRQRLTEEGALGLKAGSHYHRILVQSPDRAHWYVSVGSTSNVLEDPMPHASVQRFDKDGGNQVTFASGLRNPIGTAFHPETGELYTVVNERDGYGDDLVPDYFTRVQDGEFFGWPYAYIGGLPDAKFADKRPDLVAATKLPDVLFQAHSAPVGLVFYTGDQFPEDYQGDAFVSLHGSWNRSDPTGYKIVRIPFENGRPKGGYENFMTGFLRDVDGTPRITGRPAGLAQMPDGSLLLAEDGNNIIWRIRYVGTE